MSRGKVDIVLVGADRIAANGDVANKIGTYSLGVLAKENGIPFYSVAPTSTIDLSVQNGTEIPIEERDPREVTHFRGMPVAAEGVTAAHPAFDVTPHRYITGIVTEVRIIYPPFAVGLRQAKAIQDPAACQSVERCELETRLLQEAIARTHGSATTEEER
jgi:methylthioribose-1-phosphate isomerase